MTLHTSRFNTDQVEEVKARVVELTIHGTNGLKLPIFAIAISKMAPIFKQEPLRLSSETFMKTNLMNPINMPPQKSANRAIDLLIGSLV